MAAVFAALGAWALWSAFDPIHYDRSYGAGGVVLGLVSLWFAWRALGQWAARRRR
jgi:hypothetical protein